VAFWLPTAVLPRGGCNVSTLRLQLSPLPLHQPPPHATTAGDFTPGTSLLPPAAGAASYRTEPHRQQQPLGVFPGHLQQQRESRPRHPCAPGRRSYQRPTPSSSTCQACLLCRGLQHCSSSSCRWCRRGWWWWWWPGSSRRAGAGGCRSSGCRRRRQQQQQQEGGHLWDVVSKTVPSRCLPATVGTFILLSMGPLCVAADIISSFCSSLHCDQPYCCVVGCLCAGW
jgi:hypothetical protein